MRFVIDITLGNDAMQDGPDVARALRKIADVVESCTPYVVKAEGPGTIRDENGNKVGTWRFK